MDEINKYIEKNKERFIREWITLLRIPSISADPAYAPALLQCAEAVKKCFELVGVDKAVLYPTAGAPIVYAEKIRAPSLPTVLVYGHYDVQPVDPLDLWETPPFEPVIRQTAIHPEGALFARGACDDKGQFFMHLKAFEWMIKAGTLPCNIKFMIEGEEEVGSTHLEPFIKANKELLHCETILISDTGIISNEIPSITVGLRGLSYLEVEVTGPNRELHSGLYGGTVANPINTLCEMIASLKDASEHITVPGFYEHVCEVSKEDREEMARAPFSLEEYKGALELPAIQGEKGYTTVERLGIRPSLDVNGIWGGYTGKGAKTVIPSKAYAKISMRLVPNQTEEEITKKVRDYLLQRAPKSVQVTVTPCHGGDPYLSPTSSSAYQAASQAMEKTFGKKPLPIRSGASIPIVSLFEKELGVHSILMGFGLDSDAIHSPNEHFGLYNFFKGIETLPHFFTLFTSRYCEKTQ